MNEERTYSTLTLAAGVVIVLMVIYQFVVPMPKPKGAQKYARDEMQLALDQRVAIEKGDKLESANSARLWNVGPEALGPIAMARVSNMAKGLGLSLVSFRPQRNASAGELVRSGFIVTVEGSFPRAIEFARKLETPETKLAVVSMQVTSTDGASDAVTATVGVVAYRDREAGVKPVTSAKTEPKSTLASENKKPNP